MAVPWGHIAAKAWGSQKGSPILCLHGWLDNANSFDRLIPLLPRDFYYVAMDFGGHGLSSHYSPGLPYYYQNFVGEIRRVSAGGTVGGMFSCMFPEMVEKLILLDSSPFVLDSNELENLLTYKRKVIEHTLLVEQAAQEPSRALSPEEMLQRFLKNNSHVGEECGELLLQRGATPVPAGKALTARPAGQHASCCSREASGLLSCIAFQELQKPEVKGLQQDPQGPGPLRLQMPTLGCHLYSAQLAKKKTDPRVRMRNDSLWLLPLQPEHAFDFISKELCAHAIKKLQAHVLLIKATDGFFDVRREYDADKGLILFMTDQLKSALGERFQFVEIPGNHYVHMNQPDHVASIIGSFLQDRNRIPAQR
ncbi:PREDICTED: serine hydrolase-like protein 2 [Myotis davidii]|uniref:serine hydrolase-like protein 2 n=1 Tax=Myotis davidii TaxID=225400 RepID=UPI000766EB11|nr:PREDICTED: serine hydrolase-like protein 2 [Myotis davidii]